MTNYSATPNVAYIIIESLHISVSVKLSIYKYDYI